MDTPTVMGFVALGISVIGSSSTGLIWAVRQEGRINAHDNMFEEREKQDVIRFQELVRRLDRIERKQDVTNGK